MRIRRLPNTWPSSIPAAIATQAALAGRVRTTGDKRSLRFVAGLDAAFTSEGRACIGGVVLWDIETATTLEERTALRPVRFPYIPGLLSFREMPALLSALRKLERTPDLLMCDGHGLAHPRRFGIACHLGVMCALPAIGCAKSLLIGEHAAPAARRGSWSPLRHRDEIVGCVLRTREGVRPVYVSIGHQISLAVARGLVMKCAARFRLPEPTHLADRLVARVKRELARS
jgi:deoxyribonuclease V